MQSGVGWGGVEWSGVRLVGLYAFVYVKIKGRGESCGVGERSVGERMVV